MCVGGEGGVLSLTGSQTSFWATESDHFLTGFVFLVHIQENLEDELVKEALEKVGNNALGADFLWIQRYYAHKLPVTRGVGGGVFGGC